MRMAILSVVILGCSAAQSMALDPKCSAADIRSAASGVEIPPAYQRPEMMAIGDSMFNGVVSASMGPSLAKYSVPVLVARAAGLKNFRVAEYSRFVLWDAEAQLNRGISALLRGDSGGPSLGRSVGRNIEAWQRNYHDHPEVKTLFFDNVAVAGATSVSLLCETKSDDTRWETAPVKLQPNKYNFPEPPPGGSSIAQWFFDINDAFLLDPSNDPKIAKLSQMAQVVARKPARLLVNIGSNDSVWMMAFRGLGPDDAFKRDEDNKTSTIRAELKDLVKNMKMVAELMPPETKYVYVNNLVPPSRSANLAPPVNPLPCMVAFPAAKSYHATYTPYISTRRTHWVGCGVVHQMDQVVCEANREIADAMRRVLGPRLVVVDLAKMLWSFDKKHVETEGDARSIEFCKGILVRNEGKTVDFNWGIKQYKLDNNVVKLPSGVGGLQSYDNMHPTIFAYAKMASVIEDAMANGPEKTHLVLNTDVQRLANELRANHVPTTLRMSTTAVFLLDALHRYMGLLDKAQAQPSKNDEEKACALAPMMFVGHRPESKTELSTSCGQN